MSDAAGSARGHGPGCGCGRHGARLADTKAEIDTTPTAGMREEAERGLAWRREYGRGGTAVGVARARDIAGGRNLSEDTVRRMASYFARHEVDKKGKGWSPGGEGFPSAGRIAWALWGGDAGARWASKVVGQFDRVASLADRGRDRVTVLGADGREFTTWRELRPEELDVAWATLADRRADLDANVAARLETIAIEHRAAVWDKLADGFQPGELDPVWSAYRVRYEEAIADYARDVRADAADATAAEATRASVGGRVLPASRPGVDVEGLRRSAEERMARIAAQATTAAETLANRVQSEVQAAWAAGATVSTWASRIGIKGLSLQTRQIGDAVERAQKLSTAANPSFADEGLTPSFLVRSGVMDGNICDHCEGLDGQKVYADEMQVRPGVVAIPELPDPECAGGAGSCRCGWLIVWQSSESGPRYTRQR